MKILITGGAGYIGSHTLYQFLKYTNHSLFVLDNLSKGSMNAINELLKIRKFEFFNIDLKDFARIKELFKKYDFDCIIHFAASIEVFESMNDPLKYYFNNTLNTTNLIQTSLENNIKYFIFSSTAAVYGEPIKEKVDENHPLDPINPYGRSKLMSEKIMQDAFKNSDIKFAILRYFNVAGACIDFNIGHNYPNATLLTKVLAEVACKKRAKFFIYGDDYDTMDGTCIRDFIHVDDMASAHLASLEYLFNNDSNIFNVGYGNGFSVKNIVDTMKKINKVDFEVELKDRRAGDPSVLIADPNKILKLTKWRPKYNDINIICKSIYEWEKKL